MKSRGLALAVLVAAAAGWGGIPGHAAVAIDTEIKFERVDSKWIVQTNGTWAVEAEITIRPPAENPSRIVTVPIGWSNTTERLTIVHARVERPNGKTVDAPPLGIREPPPTGARYFHEISDQRRYTITFPDVGPDDVLSIRTKREVFHPRVPGGFMTAPTLDRTVGWEDTNYTISVPLSMGFKMDLRGFEHQAETIIDRRVHYLRAPKTSNPARDIGVLSQFDRYPGFSVSTFNTWSDFARAYETVLLPHAAATPPVKALAEKLTAGETGKREQAQKLYEWVRDNIRFIPIPLEESRADPRDAADILTNGFGDTKEHAVLLHALLGARGIPAEFVLLNAADSATLAGAPNLRPMNHVLLFVPSLDLYLDTTLGVAPFGVLSFSEYGKPAIFMGGAASGRRDMPMLASGANISESRTIATFGDDGEVTGITTTTARGAFGVWLRSSARAFGQANPAAAAQTLRENGTPGSGAYSFGPPNSASAEYTVSGTFHLQNQSPLLTRGFFVPWTGLRILPRPGDFLVGPLTLGQEGRNVATFCYPGIQSEEIALTLPASRTPSSLPPDVKIESELIRYSSQWRMDGRKLTIARMFQSLVPGPVCEGTRRWENLEIMAKIRADLSNPIGLRLDQAIAPGPDRK